MFLFFFARVLSSKWNYFFLLMKQVSNNALIFCYLKRLFFFNSWKLEKINMLWIFFYLKVLFSSLFFCKITAESTLILLILTIDKIIILVYDFNENACYIFFLGFTISYLKNTFYIQFTKNQTFIFTIFVIPVPETL